MAFVLRRDAGLYGYERALRRAGFSLIAGADEAGRGACAGPLVAASVILGSTPAAQVTGLRDSKLLSPAQRERCYDKIMVKAVAWSVVLIEPDECDRLGMHVANIQALRRAVCRLDATADFVLTDGFGVDGLGVPSLAVWKGDAVAGCVAAASVVAKVTRDRIMTAAHERWPDYRFDIHKGYCTPLHQQHLDRHGPCEIHRFRFENVRRAAAAVGRRQPA
ncbi:MAG: ribonuclease HII [Micropruina sp.]|uniref:ribonuclease HII n=1 Tax=Micropruina sp. TaxID=2737536 RepID=UPI0039E2E048